MPDIESLLKERRVFKPSADFAKQANWGKKKVREYRKLGFTYVQLHDDDVVPADWDSIQTARGVKKVHKLLESEGLKGEFIAPRLWEDPRTADGA